MLKPPVESTISIDNKRTAKFQQSNERDHYLTRCFHFADATSIQNKRAYDKTGEARRD